MSKKYIVTATIVLSSFFSTIAEATLLPPELTDQDINTLVALEATQNTLLLTALHLNQPYTNDQYLGRWSGNISLSGWSLEFSGVLNGTDLSITQTGVLDLANNKATWINSGHFGLDVLAGDGSILFDPSWTEVLFGIAVGAVQVMNATTVVGGVVGVIVSGLLIAGEVGMEEAAADVKGKIEKKENQQTKVSSEITMKSSTFSPDPLLDVRFTQTGFLDPTTGRTTFEAQSSTVPEPSTIVLMVTGMAALVWCSARKKQHL